MELPLIYFNWYLLRLFAAAVVIGVFPIAMMSAPGKIGPRWRSEFGGTGGPAAQWLKAWLNVAGALALLELGRWLPWTVIRAMPELAVAQLVGWALWALAMLNERHEREPGWNQRQAQEMIVFGVWISWCLTLIWLGGHYA